MAANAMPAPDAEPKTAYNSIAGLLGDWIRQGTEGFVAAQKVFLDLAAQQNALALSIVRDRVGFTPPSARKLADLGGKTAHTLLDMQRQFLDLVMRENSIFQAGMKTRLAKTPLSGVAHVLHQSLEQCVGAEKQLLDFVQTQSDGAMDDFGEGKPFDTGRLKEVAREAVNRILDSQKQFLSLLQDQIAKTKEAAEEPAAETIDLVDMAKQSVDALVETQQKLLDMVTEQVKTNVSFAREIVAVDAHPATFSEVVKKSVDSFVAAQKALVDLAAKPRQPGDGDQGHAAAA